MLGIQLEINLVVYLRKSYRHLQVLKNQYEYKLAKGLETAYHKCFAKITGGGLPENGDFDEMDNEMSESIKVQL